MRRRIPALAAAALLPLAAAALDGPHSGVFGEDCDSCHTGHNSFGTSLTTYEANANLCFSCHDASTYFGLWNDLVDQAVPGVSGHSHSWSGAATNAQRGATAPGAPMGQHLSSGNLKCSTCHDTHNYQQSAGGSQHASAVTRAVNGLGGNVTLHPPLAGAIARGYLIDIVTAGGAGAAKFRVSHDGKTWRGWDGAWVDWVDGVTGGRTTGADVALDDPSNAVTVDFTGSFAIGDRYKFYVGQAFLRVPNGEDAMCTTCHASRDMTHTAWSGPTTGNTVFSHPVGEGLNANTLGHDRAPNAILDADGATTQLTGDSEPTNNLNLSASGKVTCTSCHAPHNADSNSLTPDKR
jgi:predicted CXXCH cytochrome family protein